MTGYKGLYEDGESGKWSHLLWQNANAFRTRQNSSVLLQSRFCGDPGVYHTNRNRSLRPTVPGMAGWCLLMTHCQRGHLSSSHMVGWAEFVGTGLAVPTPYFERINCSWSRGHRRYSEGLVQVELSALMWWLCVQAHVPCGLSNSPSYDSQSSG